MEATQTPATPEQTPPKPNLLRNGWFSRGFLLVAGLFFLLPFININCSGNKLASVNGIDMVIGADVKPALPQEKKETISPGKDSAKKEFESGLDSLSIGLNAIADSISGELISKENPFAFPGDLMGQKDKRIEPNPLAIASVAGILLALILSFFPSKIMAILAGVFSILSALSLFYLQVQANAEIQKQMGPFNFIPITIEFTSYYWLCVLFIVLGSVFAFVRSAFVSSKS
jgi:hypothetical protein